MAAITDLAAASSVAAADLLVVNQSGTDRKVTADKFVTVNSSGATTVIARATITTVALANNATQTVSGSYGVLIVINGSQGGQLMAWMLNGVASINQVGTTISTTAGTASKLNVYYSGGVYYIENKTGATCNVFYGVIGV